jgi:hypothetical protein
VRFENLTNLANYIEEQVKKTPKETELSSVYFMITNDDGSKHIVYFEPSELYFSIYACQLVLIGNSMHGKELFDYVKEHYKDNIMKAYDYEQTMMLDGKHYKIGLRPALHLIPEKFNIEPMTERECLEWLVSKER